ncbi:SRPBCC domain-containing protein [Celeribacter arenosi]|uniref:Activator of Hsp90 ATPase homologue 1/2-like C-terminal domain-containing protein n=1 Tax=Celeribacter arenosi TaxID=792649 RepID=A0ABP7KDC7_9RHOB
MTDTPTFVIERHFSAPPELVWRAWADPSLLSHWYGPGVTTVIHELDLREGGRWLTEMKMGENSMFQRADFTHVTDGERLVCSMSTTDAQWSIIANPMVPDWPRILQTEVTMRAADGGTDLRLVWTPQDASEAELAFFAKTAEQSAGGWGKGFDVLETMLADLS